MDFQIRKNLRFLNLTPDYGIADDVHDTPYAYDATRFNFTSPHARFDDTIVCYRVDETGYVHFEKEIHLQRHELRPVPHWAIERI